MGGVIIGSAQCTKKTHQFPIQRIAHAGGGINDETYTNSLEALDLNLKQGFLFFELDFSFTSDNQLVCLHDWKHSFRRSFGFNTKKKLTLKEFEKLVKEKSQFHKLSIDLLSEWMIKNTSAIIITDVKENNIEALKILLQKIPNAKKRIIPQIYFPENFQKVKNMGFEKIIWTLYRYKGNNNEVLKWVDQFSQPFAITMPKRRAVTSLPKLLKKKHIASYVHTINSLQGMKYYKKFGISEIYTDFLLPNYK